MSSENSNSPDQRDALYEIPFLVGIAGHRDPLPAQVPAIGDAIEKLFRRLMAAQPDVQLQLICPMADGADLLVADIAQKLGIHILALLTFPEDICRSDLRSDEARASFDRVLAGAEKLQMPMAPGVTRESLLHSGADRDRQYQRAALLLARYCSLLVTIWDGKPTDHAAGTARVIEFRQRGIRLSHEKDLEPADVLLSACDNDLIYDIRCARSSDPVAVAGPAPPIDVRGFVGAEVDGAAGSDVLALPRSLASLLGRTADFNRDTRAAAAEIRAGGRPLGSAGAESAPATLRLVDQLFIQADYLGGHFRRAFLGAIKFRYTMWAAMATFLFAFDKASTGVTGLAIILVVLAIFLAGRVHASRAHRHSWHRKYLDYRALAEALRVDYFWEVTGVRRRYAGEFAHESFLQKQDMDLEWIRSAMRAVSLRVAMQAGEPSAAGFAQASADWIGDDSAPGSGQLSYYGARAGQLHHKLHAAEKIDKGLLAVGLTLSVTFLIDVSLSLAGFEFLPHTPRHYMLWAMALLTVYAGIFESYLAEKADRTLIRQYRYMHSLFRLAAQELKYARTEDHKLEILRSLGHACLAEHAQWTLAQRDKTIQGLKW